MEIAMFSWTSRALVALAFTTAAIPASVEAADYDMDCKLILCLAGGFPSGCADAKSYMFSRIKQLKPPIGVCNMVGGAGGQGETYDDIKTEYDFLTPATDERGWACADSSKRIAYARQELEYTSRLSGFCYESVRYIEHSGGHDGNAWTEPVYSGVENAREVDFQVRVTVEPGKPNEFRSSLFKVNTRNGFTAELP